MIHLLVITISCHISRFTRQSININLQCTYNNGFPKFIAVNQPLCYFRIALDQQLKTSLDDNSVAQGDNRKYYQQMVRAIVGDERILLKKEAW
jgi:hypothetical protein